ncbi:MAG TPA: HAD-IG family 5'-nucleotidase [Polyangia bacterium]|nr:HAD-IG family 5'-nucleotidase [Polyangia bacterium]
MSSGGDAAVIAPLPGSDVIRSLTRPLDVPRGNRVYVNRNLRLDRIEMVGFDMDYTLALYNQPRIEELSMRATLHKLVTAKGYPQAIRDLGYDPMLAIRGLVVDRDNGNIFKPDRYGFPGRARHGLGPIDRAKVSDLYQSERTRLSNRRYAWIDSLFALPEAVLYACLVDYFDRTPLPSKPDYNTLWEHIRECIDLAHRDGSIKTIVGEQLSDYVERDLALAETLHKFRSSGKRLFLLTNSAWDYTTRLMAHLLDGALAAYPSWRSYFDVIVVSAGKPEFFTEARPFVDLDGEGLPLLHSSTGPFLRGRVYSGGNLKEFQVRAKASGDRVLFLGDHIYGDMLRSRKSSNWRTAMILQELEHEVLTYDRQHKSLAQLDQLDSQLVQLDAELNERQSALRTLQKLEERGDGGGNGAIGLQSLKAAKKAIKDEIERLRKELRAATAAHREVEDAIDEAFNPYWGPLFREGYEISKFGEQVEAYACVYTSRVSNFRFYSPMQYFRGPRDRMPHER